MSVQTAIHTERLYCSFGLWPSRVSRVSLVCHKIMPVCDTNYWSKSNTHTPTRRTPRMTLLSYQNGTAECDDLSKTVQWDSNRHIGVRLDLFWSHKVWRQSLQMNLRWSRIIAFKGNLATQPNTRIISKFRVYWLSCYLLHLVAGL